MHEFTVQFYGISDEKALEMYHIIKTMLEESKVTSRQSLLWNVDKKVIN